MPQPLSVIMPIYNGARTLAHSFASITDADAEGLEIIAVVQECADASRQIVERAAERLPIRIIDVEAGSNWVRNTNIGLRAATADLVTMLHQDDLWMPGRRGVIDASVAAFPEARLWAHPARYVDARDRTIGRIGPPFGRKHRLVPGDEAIRTLLVQNSIPLPGAVFRRDAALGEGGLREDLWYTADWDLWLRLAADTGIGWSPEPACAFRIHVESQTVRGSSNAKDFAGQMQIPLDQHGPGDPLTARMARTSVALNLFLAGRYHGQSAPMGPFVTAYLGLGPLGWLSFFRRSQIVARLAPRLRLLLSARGKTA